MPYNIILNVYDLPEQASMNNNLRTLGFGLYHTGVQFHNHEYSFSSQGVCRTRPLLPEFGTIREKIHVATYEGTIESFLNIVDHLQMTRFRPGMYDVMHLNCNHFSDALLQEACGAHVPDWVNRAANVGSGISAGKSSKSRSADSSSFIAPGKVKSPTLPTSFVDDERNVEDTSQSSSSTMSSVFNWFFGSLSESSKSVPTSSSAGGCSKKDPKKKKELTEKQKAMLEKIKSGNK